MTTVKEYTFNLEFYGKPSKMHTVREVNEKRAFETVLHHHSESSLNMLKAIKLEKIFYLNGFY